MPSGIGQTISIVVAMYNEEESLPQLFERLATLQSEKPRDWRLDFVLVNDGSSDRTMEVASRLKPAKWDVRILSHSVNQDFGAAIRTGFAAARGEIVVFYDTFNCYGGHCYGGQMEPHTSAMEPHTSH